MKIIFLDIDGVLNNSAWLAKQGNFRLFDPINVEMLNVITWQTGAKIVVSSNWRMYPYNFVDIFKRQNVEGSFLGCTPDLSVADKGIILRATTRGQEIKKWIENYGLDKEDRFVIIDDNDDMEDLSPYLVQTKMWCGLVRKDAEAAIRILMEK